MVYFFHRTRCWNSLRCMPYHREKYLFRAKFISLPGNKVDWEEQLLKMSSGSDYSTGPLNLPRPKSPWWLFLELLPWKSTYLTEFLVPGIDWERDGSATHKLPVVQQKNLRSATILQNSLADPTQEIELLSLIADSIQMVLKAQKSSASRPATASSAPSLWLGSVETAGKPHPCNLCST